MLFVVNFVIIVGEFLYRFRCLRWSSEMLAANFIAHIIFIVINIIAIYVIRHIIYIGINLIITICISTTTTTIATCTRACVLYQNTRRHYSLFIILIIFWIIFMYTLTLICFDNIVFCTLVCRLFLLYNLLNTITLYSSEIVDSMLLLFVFSFQSYVIHFIILFFTMN